MPHQSLGGALYFVSFIDDSTRRVWAYPIKTKDSVLDFFQMAHYGREPVQSKVEMSSNQQWRGVKVKGIHQILPTMRHMT